MYRISKVKVSLVILLLIILGVSVWAQAPATPVAPATPTPEAIITVPVPIYNVPAAQVMKLLSKHPDFNTLVSDDPSNIISITGTQVEIDTMKAEIAKYDLPKKIIMVSGMCVVTYNNSEKDRGVDWSVSNDKDAGGFWNLTISDTIFKFTNKNLIANFLGYDGSNELEILQKPKVVTLDGQEAFLFAGETTFIPTYAAFGGPVVKIDPVKSGTSFKVTPKILPNHEYLVKVDIDVSEASNAGLGNYPASTNRITQSTYRVKEGESFAVSGLISSIKQDYKSKTPFLERIPIVGKVISKLVGQHKRLTFRMGEVSIFVKVEEMSQESITAPAERAAPVIEERTPGNIKIEEVPKVEPKPKMEDSTSKSTIPPSDKPADKPVTK